MSKDAPAEDVVRIAVTNVVSTAPSGQSQNHHLQLHRSTPIRDVVAELCRHWRLDRQGDAADADADAASQDYALTFEKTKQYVTERNRAQIKNGTVRDGPVVIVVDARFMTLF